jgi:hypothetical protein
MVPYWIDKRSSQEKILSSRDSYSSSIQRWLQSSAEFFCGARDHLWPGRMRRERDEIPTLSFEFSWPLVEKPTLDFE